MSRRRQVQAHELARTRPEPEPDPGSVVPLDFFLGPQRLTHLYAGIDGLLGIDGDLYRFVRRLNPCPHRVVEGYDYTNGHSRYCDVTSLSYVRWLTADELNSIQMVVELRSVDKMVTFHRHAELPLIYAIDESWGTATSGAIVCEMGSLDAESPRGHARFVFRYDLDGYVPAWWPKAEPEQPEEKT